MELNFNYSIDIKAKPQTVFDIISDVENLHETMIGIGAAKDYPGGPLEAGSMWLVPQTLEGDEHDIEYEVVDLDPPSSMEWSATSPYGTSFSEWKITETTVGSRLTLEVSMTMPDSTDAATRRSWSSDYDEATKTNMQRIKAAAEAL